MILKLELVKRIKEYFDLNIYETKVWLALLSKGIASAREIADMSGVPRSRTYDVLESLEKRGYAITKIGKPVKYISVKPTDVIEKMKTHVSQEAQDKIYTLSNMKETPEYKELENLHTVGISPINPHEITGLMKGRANVISHLRNLFEQAQNEVVIFTSLADFEDKSRVIIPSLERFNRRNLRIKVALSGDNEKIKKISAKHNIKIKQVDSNARFFIIDKKEILLIITPINADEEIGVWLKSPYFTESLTRMIENLSRTNHL